MKKFENTQGKEINKSCFSLAHSVSQINAVLTKYPVTATERQQLTPSTNQVSSTDGKDPDIENVLFLCPASEKNNNIHVTFVRNYPHDILSSRLLLPTMEN